MKWGFSAKVYSFFIDFVINPPAQKKSDLKNGGDYLTPNVIIIPGSLDGGWAHCCALCKL